jgi:hypothetical protein
MRCVFCGLDTKPTREHVAPQWLRTRFPDEGKVPHMRVWQEDGRVDARVEWESIPFAITKKVVCVRPATAAG